MRSVVSCVLALSFGAPAFALPVDDLQRGESYFVHRTFGPNDLVTVLSVDRASGRVKVQYQNGAVDYVSAGELQTQTESRRADTADAVAGTAIIGGALWAILDPAGFKQAMANQSRANDAQAQASPGTAAAPVVAVKAVPFAPLLAGEWSDKGADWVSFAENVIEESLGERRAVASVRIKQVPFYKKKDVWLAECAEVGRTGAYYLLVVPGDVGAVMLDGFGGGIQAFNAKVGLSIATAADALAYVRFFSSAIAAQDGVFVMLSPDMAGVDAATLRQMRVRPVEVEADATGWRIRSDVVYGRNMSWVLFHVTPAGVVEMLHDQLEQFVSFEYQVLMQKGRRVYVAAEKK